MHYWKRFYITACHHQTSSLYNNIGMRIWKKCILSTLRQPCIVYFLSFSATNQKKASDSSCSQATCFLHLPNLPLASVWHRRRKVLHLFLTRYQVWVLKQQLEMIPNPLRTLIQYGAPESTFFFFWDRRPTEPTPKWIKKQRKCALTEGRRGSLGRKTPPRKNQQSHPGRWLGG